LAHLGSGGGREKEEDAGTRGSEFTRGKVLFLREKKREWGTFKKIRWFRAHPKKKITIVVVGKETGT